MSAARERPILMSAPMVMAILAGRKTQTRRIVKPQPPLVEAIHARVGAGYGWGSHPKSGGVFVPVGPVRAVLDAGGPESISSPYGVPGDRLWVRETHAQFSVGEGTDRPVPQCVAYRATCDRDGGFDYANGRGEVQRLGVTKWTPAIHMPRWASRLTLEVTEIRVQRLQDISEADAAAEGLRGLTKDGGRTVKYGIPDRDGWPGTDDHGWPWHEWEVDPRKAFAKLWDKINGERAPWASNPWLWCVTFRRVEGTAP